MLRVGTPEYSVRCLSAMVSAQDTGGAAQLLRPGRGSAGKSQARGRRTIAVHQEEEWTSTLGSAMVWVRVGKEFPDKRQNEREVTFIRMGVAVSGPVQWGTEVEQESLVHFYSQGTRSGIGVLWVMCCLDEACILGRGRSKANTFSLWGRKGDRVYCSGGPEIR